MATLDELISAGRLERWTADLKRGELPHRCVYLLTGVYRDFLADCHRAPDRRGLLDPAEQLSMRLNAFIGRPDPPRIGDEIKQISPDREGLFEFRTPDTRLVGWFTHPGVFVGCEAFLKSSLRRRGGMKQMKERAFAARDALDLDAPKFLGGPYANVHG
jgi:hypothetical protein